MRFQGLSGVIGAAALWLSLAGWAQEAPTGDHYAGRPTDTGFGGIMVGSAGDVEPSLRLDLPPERAGLPIPLQVRYSAHHVGAAGLGWDVPLSYLQRDSTFAYRRPMYVSGNGGYNLPQPRERALLSLPGMGGELVRSGANWVLRHGALDVLVRATQTGWRAYDGAGRTYVFTQPTQLLNQGLWLLSDIQTSGGRSVHLDYQISSWPINGGRGLEIDLVRIAYNTTALSGCAKNEITLAYGNPSPSPIALSMIGDQPVVRRRTLARVDVQARATCQTPLERLRRIVLTYAPDADLQLPQLLDAQMYGRQGTPEANTAIPLGTFSYGTATQDNASTTHPGRVLRYTTTQTLPWPADADDNGVAWLGLTKVDSGLSAPEDGQVNGLWQDLIDVNGDGRADVVYQKNGKLAVLLNYASAGGATSLNTPAVPLNDATFQSGPLAVHSSSSQRFWYGTASRNTVDVWRRTIDMNGDGRLDVVDASEEAGRWVIYLNTPGGPNGFHWVRRSISVKNLEAELVSQGHVLADDHVPLSRRTTGVSVDGVFCIHRASSTQPYTPYEGNVGANGGTVHCNDQGVPDTAPPLVCDQAGLCKPREGIEKTFVEWDLLDLNGDGYPDVIYNSRAVDFFVTPGAAGTSFDGNKGWFGNTYSDFRLPFTATVRVAFNILGVHLDSAPDESSPFARSVAMNLPEMGLPGAVPSGVALWKDDGSGTNRQVEVAGFADINGDGLLDRVAGHSAYLGVYAGTSRLFSSAFLTLPNQGYLSVQTSNQKDRCGSHDTFNSQLVQGLRDLTGDGIPDYFDNGQVYLGTGAGFSATPVFIQSSVPVHLSDQPERCQGQWSETDAGLYDLDGDGKPEWVSVDPGNHTISVAQLASGVSPRAAEAGRLTGVGNGYGASTQFTYVSAKEDLYSTHAVPFSEIVVTASRTSDDHHLGGRLAQSGFAYGNVSMQFDALRDRFVSSGYGRTVRLQGYSGKGDQPMAMGSVADTWQRQPYTPAMCQNLTVMDCKTKQWLGLLQQGQPRDVYTLMGSPETDPWAYLDIDANDTRIIGNRHTVWGARLFELPTSTPNATNIRECLEMAQPYDFATSFGLALGPNGFNPCLAHGFVHASTIETWFGQSPPPWGNNVQTRLRVLNVDDFARTTALRDDRDVFRSDDDLCTEKVFATPTPGLPRVLSALASRRLYDCDKATTFASETLNYDGLPAGRVSRGRLTSHNVDRRATDDGTVLRSVHVLDATYDAAGNVASVRTQRQGLLRSTTFDYDPFGLAPLRTTVSATGLASRSAQLSLDPGSLDVLGTTDLHGVVTGAVYDGFGRLTQSTMAVPAGASGVLTTASYDGFDGVGGTGRRVTVTSYPDPVPPASLSTAVGRSATTFIDELGRVRRSEVALGADYANDHLVVGDRIYDEVGRLSFEAEPYAASEVLPNHFGTTYFYQDNGDLRCLVRGSGVQGYTHLTDMSQDRYVTCFDRAYDNHVMTADVLDAASLVGEDPQQWVKHRVVSSAAGWVLERSTVRGGTRLEYATLSHDPLGQIVSMNRFQSPDTAANPITWSWRRDSLGHAVRTKQPEAAPRYFEFDDWGELTDIHWKDGATERRLSRQFDALGRLTQAYELNNGVPDQAAAKTLIYDVPSALSPLASPTFVEDRLAGARWAGGKLAFSYDALGHPAAEVIEDTAGALTVQQMTHHVDGALDTLAFLLPDRNFAPETVRYGYDSAGQMRTVDEQDNSGAASLYRADTIDSWGRVLQAHYGTGTTLAAQYAGSGRRLLQSVSVQTPSGSRRLSFGAYDALGRETNRQEFVNEVPVGAPALKWYNDVGQLASVARQGSSLDAWKFVYDGVGNLTYLMTSNPGKDVTLTTRSLDGDRVCRLEYSGNLTGTDCNVEHDGSGAVTHEPTRNGSRDLTYFASGLVRTLSDGNAHAAFSYDALDRLQTLDLQGGSSADQRRDRNYGDLITRRDISGTNGVTTQWLRRIPGPGGIVATRQGTASNWIYDFGESRGNRFMTNDAGAFVQDVTYTPFGEATSSGAVAASADYTSHQWNGGDALAAFGLSNLGTRLYDPVIGRFLSRDPLVTARGALASHPYAFAMNDPVNASDPSGMNSCMANDPFCISTSSDPGSDGSLATAALSVAWGIWDFFSSVGGPSGTAEPGAVLQGPAPGGGPVTPQGVMLQYLAQSQLGYSVAGFRYDTAAATGEEWSSILDRLADLPSPERDAQIDAYNAKLDRYAHYARVGGLMVAGGALGIGAAAAVVGIGTGAAMASAGAVGVGAAEAGGAALSTAEVAPAIPAAVMAADEFGPESAETVECALGACGGPGVCFVGGTPVATPRGAVPIENIRVGERVTADNVDCSKQHLAPDSVTITLEMANPRQPTDLVHLELVRSRSWLAEHGFKDGKVVIEMPEQGLSGSARVVGVGAPPTEEPGTGCLVLSATTHIADKVLALKAEGGTVLELTPEHRLYVEGRGWTAAGDVRLGQTLRSMQGPERLLGVAPSRRNQRVYNIEVGTEHSYRVGKEGIWAHNTCEDPLRYLRLVDEEFNAAYERLGRAVLGVEKWQMENKGLATPWFTWANRPEDPTFGRELLGTLLEQAERYSQSLSPAEIEAWKLLLTFHQ